MRPIIVESPLTDQDIKLLTDINAKREGARKFTWLGLVLLIGAIVIWSILGFSSDNEISNTYLVVIGLLLVISLVSLYIVISTTLGYNYVRESIEKGTKKVLRGTLTEKTKTGINEGHQRFRLSFSFGPRYHVIVKPDDYEKFNPGDLVKVTFDFYHPKFQDLTQNDTAQYIELEKPAAKNDVSIEDLKRFDDDYNNQLKGNTEKNEKLTSELKKVPHAPGDKALILKYYAKRFYVLSILGLLCIGSIYVDFIDTGIWSYLVLFAIVCILIGVVVVGSVELTKRHKWLEMKYLDNIKTTSSEYVGVEINKKSYNLKKSLLDVSDLSQPAILHRTAWKKHAFDFTLKPKEIS